MVQKKEHFTKVALRPEVTFAEEVEARRLGSGSARSRSATSFGAKRLLLPTGDENIPKKRKLDLNIRSSMLSAGFKSRFKHICTDL